MDYIHRNAEFSNEATGLEDIKISYEKEVSWCCACNNKSYSYHRAWLGLAQKESGHIAIAIWILTIQHVSLLTVTLCHVT